MSRLDTAFFARPFAHRGLHDRPAGVAENSLSACRRAVEAGYGVEIDVRLSSDGLAVVFHDRTLERLTEVRGPLAERAAASLGMLPLDGTEDAIPTLAEVFATIGARAPLLIELKAPDDGYEPSDGRLEEAVAEELRRYDGPVAAMSFNPSMLERMRVAAPAVPRGLVAGGYGSETPADRRAALEALTAYEEVGASFVSYHWRELPRPETEALRALGAPIVCWTVRSPSEAAEVAPHVDQITFEGFRP